MMRTKHERWTGTAALAVLLAAGFLPTAWGQGSATRSGSEAGAAAPAAEAELNAAALKALINAKVPLLLLDARGVSEQRIPGAVAMAHDANEQALRQVAANPDQLIVTYCGGPDCPMSQMLAERLAQAGCKNVIRFKGGIEAWTQAALPLQAAQGNTRPAERAVPTTREAAPRASGSGSR